MAVKTDQTLQASQPSLSKAVRVLPLVLMAAGGVVSGAGLWLDARQWAASWLVGVMFFVSLSLGALFLVLLHHLVDAGWSVPLRRLCEHLAGLLWPWLALLFVPVVVGGSGLYPWLSSNGAAALTPLQKLILNQPVFAAGALVCFGVWGVLAGRLRHWSLRQDATGEARCTRRMRRHAAWGILAYALTVTWAAVCWLQSLEPGWVSSMFPLTFFAGSVWLAVGVVYLLTRAAEAGGWLGPVLREHQYYFLGLLFFAFTAFAAYLEYSQYFIIWSVGLPEETGWYVRRQQAPWGDLGHLMVWGHFVVPFVLLLRMNAKHTWGLMLPLGLWACAMHYLDLAYVVLPPLRPEGPVLAWTDLGSAAFLAGLLGWAGLRAFAAHPPYPLRDPRLPEAMGHLHPLPAPISGGEIDEADETLEDASGAEKGAKG